jgi:hypothetical protein
MVRRLASVLLLVGVAACGEPEIVVPEVLSIVTVLPSHGAADVSPDVEALVYFSSPVKNASAATEELAIECLGQAPCETADPADCADVVSTVTFEINQVAKIKPNVILATNTCYGITIGAGIEAADKNVGRLPLAIRSDFKTK